MEFSSQDDWAVSYASPPSGQVQARIQLGSRDIGQELIENQEVIGKIVAQIAKIPEIRHCLVRMWHQTVNQLRGVVVVGRDIGTVVFPSATIKLFLAADEDQKATRRLAQESDSLNLSPSRTQIEVKADQAQRDQLDTRRSTSPLQAAGDAIGIDTTQQTEETNDQSIARMIEAAVNEFENRYTIIS